MKTRLGIYGTKTIMERATQKGKSLRRANLAWANLAGANLEGAKLEGANLAGANLAWAKLAGANLAGAKLAWANLAGANLEGANLAGANLAGANLEGANLAGAKLEGAKLAGANLEGANLAGAKLAWARLPAPTMILLASWGKLDNESTAVLMRLDASAHPDPGMFDVWAAGGDCPYSNGKVQRVCNFEENRALWQPGPPPTIWEAMCIVLDTKCPGWRNNP